MRHVKYPICALCGGEINPHKYDGCEKYYITQKGLLCRDCFLKEAQDWMELNTDDYAALVGAEVVEVPV